MSLSLTLDCARFAHQGTHRGAGIKRQSQACADVIDLLHERRIHTTPEWPAPQPAEDAEIDPIALTLPTLVVINKCGLLDDVVGEVAVFLDLLGTELPWLEESPD